jgi:hypothetical protein
VTEVASTGVEHEADALGELVEEALVRRREGGERRELDHRADRPLEEDRQHDDVQGGDSPRPGADLHVVRRDLGEQDPLALQGALPDEALAEAEDVGEVLALLVAVAAWNCRTGSPPSPRSVRT